MVMKWIEEELLFNTFKKQFPRCVKRRERLGGQAIFGPFVSMGPVKGLTGKTRIKLEYEYSPP